MISVIALDMDDTLLRSDGSISQRTLSLLEKWLLAGNRVVIATGRPPRAVVDALPPLLASVPCICYNGAEIRLDDKTIYEDLIPAEDVRFVVDWGERSLSSWRMGIEINDVLYLNRRLNFPKEYEYVPNLLSVATTPAAKVLFTKSAWQTIDEPNLDGDPFEPLAPLLSSLPPDTRAILSKRYKLAQLLSTTADKGTALRHVVEGWGLSMSNVIAFGDDVNDVEMLEEAAIGVAVSNAVHEVHNVADRVTASNDDDGVAVVLEELLAH